MTTHSRSHHREECQCEDCRPKDYAREAATRIVKEYLPTQSVLICPVIDIVRSAIAAAMADKDREIAELRDLIYQAISELVPGLQDSPEGAPRNLPSSVRGIVRTEYLLTQKLEAAEAERDQLKAECQRLEANWLSEQKERLANANLVEMYGAVKAKMQIEELKAENERLKSSAVVWKNRALMLSDVEAERDQLRAEKLDLERFGWLAPAEVGKLRDELEKLKRNP